jgi:hypothetical protein
MARVLMVVISVAITIYAVADISRTPKDELPARIPKPLWLLLAILLTPVGGLAWIIVSRVTQAEARGGQINRGMWYSDESAIKTTRFNRPRRDTYYAPAPDDDPDFLWSLEKELRTLRSEEEMREAERLMDEARAALENQDITDAIDDSRDGDSGDDPSSDDYGREISSDEGGAANAEDANATGQGDPSDESGQTGNSHAAGSDQSDDSANSDDEDED